MTYVFPGIFMYIILQQVFWCLYYYCVIILLTVTRLFRIFIYILAIYLNVIDAVLFCGIWHGSWSKASGHGLISKFNISHLASEKKII